MKKLLISLILIFLSLNINAEISQSGITDLRQLDNNRILNLINGNQLTGIISDGPFQGPISHTFYKNGKYETIIDDKTYSGIWKVANKKVCSKINNSSEFNCVYWYKGLKDGRQYYYIVAYGAIFQQFSKVISIAQLNEDKKKAEDKKIAEAKRKADAKKAEEKRKADAKKAEEKRIAEEKRRAAESKRIADAKKAESKRIADIKALEEIIDMNLKILKNHYKKLQDLELPNLKVKAYALISEVESNTSSDLSILKSLKNRLWSLNLSIRASITTEEKRIADAKQAEEIKKQAEEKRIADAKKAEEKRIADIKAAEETINSYLKIIIVLLIIMASITLAIAIRFSKP